MREQIGAQFQHNRKIALGRCEESPHDRMLFRFARL